MKIPGFLQSIDFLSVVMYSGRLLSINANKVFAAGMSRPNENPRNAHLALSQRLSPLGLIFRSPTPTSGKINLVNFRISLLKYIELITYYSRHYALSKIALLISFDHELLEL